MLFSYAVYSSLSDTCFMYFDCSRYEDGETYLAADVNIKCEGQEAGPYKASLPYAVFMSVLFPLGIPIYYFVMLYRHRSAINPPLAAVLKDRDYATAFAMSGHQMYTDSNGVLWTRQRTNDAPVHETK